jgi:hypothetical protein
MIPTELKMQPTIHFVCGCHKYPALPFKCIVGCIFNSVGLIITRESSCIFLFYLGLQFGFFFCIIIGIKYRKFMSFSFNRNIPTNLLTGLVFIFVDELKR